MNGYDDGKDSENNENYVADVTAVDLMQIHLITIPDLSNAFFLNFFLHILNWQAPTDCQAS